MHGAYGVGSTVLHWGARFPAPGTHCDGVRHCSKNGMLNVYGRTNTLSGAILSVRVLHSDFST